jgi:hypothetical protein
MSSGRHPSPTQLSSKPAPHSHVKSNTTKNKKQKKRHAHAHAHTHSLSLSLSLAFGCRDVDTKCNPCAAVSKTQAETPRDIDADWYKTGGRKTTDQTKGCKDCLDLSETKAY